MSTRKTETGEEQGRRLAQGMKQALTSTDMSYLDFSRAYFCPNHLHYLLHLFAFKCQNTC